MGTDYQLDIHTVHSLAGGAEVSRWAEGLAFECVARGNTVVLLDLRNSGPGQALPPTRDSLTDFYLHTCADWDDTAASEYPLREALSTQGASLLVGCLSTKPEKCRELQQLVLGGFENGWFEGRTEWLLDELLGFFRRCTVVLLPPPGFTDPIAHTCISMVLRLHGELQELAQDGGTPDRLRRAKRTGTVHLYRQRGRAMDQWFQEMGPQEQERVSWVDPG